SSTHCNMAEGELSMELGKGKAEGDLIDWDSDLPPLLPPSLEPSVNPVPKSSPEWAAVLTSCPERALVSMSSPERATIPEFIPKRAPVSLPSPERAPVSKSSPKSCQERVSVPKGSPESPEDHKCSTYCPLLPPSPLLSGSPSADPQPTICAVGSLRVCQSPLESPGLLLGPSTQRLHHGSYLPSLRCGPAVHWLRRTLSTWHLSSGIDHPAPEDSSGCASSLCPSGLSGSSIHLDPPWSSVAPAPPRPVGSMPQRWLPGPFVPPRPSGSSLSPWLIGSSSPPRAPPPPALPPLVGPLETSALPPPWLLPLLSIHRGSSSWLWPGFCLAPPAPSPSSLSLVCSGSSCFLLGSSVPDLHPGLCLPSSSQVSVLPSLLPSSLLLLFLLGGRRYVSVARGRGLAEAAVGESGDGVVSK
ncbi:hypothetical protein M9458_042206, partial [Cirrhinus mrigala]